MIPFYESRKDKTYLQWQKAYSGCPDAGGGGWQKRSKGKFQGDGKVMIVPI